MSLQEWSDALCAELSIEPDYDLDTILDASKQIARNVARPAVPLSAFLIGYAAGGAQGTAEDIEAAYARANALAARWPSTD